MTLEAMIRRYPVRSIATVLVALLVVTGVVDMPTLVETVAEVAATVALLFKVAHDRVTPVADPRDNDGRRLRPVGQGRNG